MSTKIYTGFSVPIRDTNRLLKDLTEFQISCAAKDINYRISVYMAVPNRLPILTSNRKYIARVPKEDGKWKDFYAYLVELYIENHDKSMTPDNIQAGAVLFYYRGNLYGWLYGDYVNDTKEYLNKLAYIRDYSYWNNSDQPKDLTARQWSARGKKWDKILDGEYTNRLIHSTVDFDGMHPSEWQIRNEIKKLRETSEDKPNGLTQ
jgi:hypothetical protein